MRKGEKLLITFILETQKCMLMLRSDLVEEGGYSTE